MIETVSSASPYPDAPNPDLLDRIPQTARVVLDIGCGTGALGAAYRRLNPRAVLLGIEHDEAAARLAASRLDQVILDDIETAPLPAAWQGRVDCLIYGDVLEHLRQPEAVLRRHLGALAPDGVVLACIPNVEHWSFLDRLLRGGWRYETQGLFDRTHLRWFTRQGMADFLDGVGLAPLDAAPRVFEPERAERFVADLTPALPAFGVGGADLAERTRPLQYVWRAQTAPAEPLHLVLTMLAPVGGVSEVRVLEPLRALASVPGVVVHLWNGREQLTIPEGAARLLILHRPALVGAEGLQTIRAALARGFVIVTEFDDHPDFIPVLQRPDMYNFSAVHAVQTTTAALASVLRPRNPELAAFPNAVRALAEPRNFLPESPLTLFFGALNRERDWPPYLDALNALGAEFGPRLRFAIVHDHGLFERLESPFKSFAPTLEYAAYRDMLARAELSFMPLADTAFNRCKSDLKFLEAAAHRVAAVASPTVYGETIRHGENGFLVPDGDALHAVVRALVAEPGRARRAAETARRQLEERRMLAYQVEARVAWYRSLWQRRGPLTEALLARVPELRLP